MTQTIKNRNIINQIDVNSSLEQLLTHIRTITSSDAGTIYLKDGDNLCFKIFQNDTISKNILEEQNTKFLATKLPLKNSKQNLVAVRSCNENKIINIENVYENCDFDLSGAKNFDAMFKYKTNSILTIPLLHPFEKENVIGVLQIINKKIDSKFENYTNDDEKLLLLASSFIGMIILNTQEYITNLEKVNQTLNEKIEIETKRNFEENTMKFHTHQIFQINEIIKNISHQWRNPLSELSLNNILLEMKVEQPEVANMFVENNQIIQNLSNTINNFQMVFDDIEKNESNRFNIKRAIYEVLAIVNIYIESYKIEIIPSIDEKIALHGNKNIFSQIILTIVQNIIEIIKNTKLQHTKLILEVFSDKKNIFIIIEDTIQKLQIDKFKKTKLYQQYFLGMEIITLLLEKQCGGKLLIDSLETGSKYTIKLVNSKGAQDDKRK